MRCTSYDVKLICFGATEKVNQEVFG
jgi:hypothetical protein